jgi:phage tail-like protein
MENLPGIYQRAESQPESFLRSFVGVLESTTQTLDARIGNLGRNIHPETATGPWLDYVARWLGLPWDDALSLDQKRRIVSRADDIASGYGTRAGLEALLECLMPEIPRRFRVVDLTADFGLAVVGGAACEGSRLPVVLGGLPSTATELGNKAILGRGRLPCADGESDAARLVGRIRIDVSANSQEQTTWEPWLRTLIGSMVPATARVLLRWLSGHAFRQTILLDDSVELDTAQEPHLGTDAVTGIARLPGPRGVALSRNRIDSGTRLH